MSDLTDYMNDHLGGSATGVQLARTLRDAAGESELGGLAGRLVDEIEEDRQALIRMIESQGDSASAVKQAGGWLGEKASVLLKARGDDAHSTISLVEMLSLGIEGKASLWRALSEISVPGIDEQELSDLTERAVRQRAELEPFRIAAARQLLD